MRTEVFGSAILIAVEELFMQILQMEEKPGERQKNLEELLGIDPEKIHGFYQAGS